MYKVALETNYFDKLLVFLYLFFFFFQFLWFSLIFYKKKLINKFFILPLSFIIASGWFGILAFFCSLLRLKVENIYLFLLLSTLFSWIINVFWVIKNIDFFKLKSICIFKSENFFILVILIFFFIAFFNIHSYPDGDAYFHISKINFFLYNGYSLNSIFNYEKFEIAYLINTTHFIFSIISFITKLSAYSVWSYSLVFYFILRFLFLWGFFKELIQDDLLTIILGLLIYLLLNDNVSNTVGSYPNNQYLYSLLFVNFFIIRSLLNKDNLNKIISITALFSIQFIHLSMNSFQIINLLAIYIAYYISIVLLNRKIEVKSEFLLAVKNFLLYFLILIPTLLVGVLSLNQIDYSQMTKVSDKTDPFIVNLYNVYDKTVLKSSEFYYINIQLTDSVGRLVNLFSNNDFYLFLILFGAILLGFKNKNKLIIVFSIYSLTLYVLIFSFGWVTQRVLPLWLLMRLNFITYYFSILMFFYIIYFFVIKFTNKNFGIKVFFIFLIFLLLISLPKFQSTRMYSRYFNSWYMQCEKFWQKVYIKNLNLKGKAFIYGDCGNLSQYYLNLFSINGNRYASESDKLLSGKINELLSNSKKIQLRKLLSLKKNIDWIIVRGCEKFKKIIKENNIKKINLNQEIICIL